MGRGKRGRMERRWKKEKERERGKEDNEQKTEIKFGGWTV